MKTERLRTNGTSGRFTIEKCLLIFLAFIRDQEQTPSIVLALPLGDCDKLPRYGSIVRKSIFVPLKEGTERNTVEPE